MIGAGIFGAIGSAAAGETDAAGKVVRSGAGPALVFSFLLLGLVCALAAGAGGRRGRAAGGGILGGGPRDMLRTSYSLSSAIVNNAGLHSNSGGPVRYLSFLWVGVWFLFGCWPMKPASSQDAGASAQPAWLDSFTLVSSGTTAKLNRVAGTSASDIWAVGVPAVGAAGVVHWDGTSWAPRYDGLPSINDPAREYLDIAALAPDNVFISSYCDTCSSSTKSEIWRWDGTRWSTMGPNLQGTLWGTAATGAWLYDGYGLRHWDGAQWAQADSSAFTNGVALAGSSCLGGLSGSDLWIYNDNQGAGHWGGTTVATISRNSGLCPVWEVSPTDVWFGAYHYDGSTVAAPPADEPVQVNNPRTSVWGSSAKDIWRTTGAALAHWNGTTWERGIPKALPSSSGISGVWGSAANDVWFVGSGGIILRYKP